MGALVGGEYGEKDENGNHTFGPRQDDLRHFLVDQYASTRHMYNRIGDEDKVEVMRVLLAYEEEDEEEDEDEKEDEPEDELLVKGRIMFPSEDKGDNKPRVESILIDLGEGESGEMM